MMSNAEKMLLEDALEQAIEVEKENIKLRRMIIFLLADCCLLLFAFCWLFF